jgi:hypothetical protein
MTMEIGWGKRIRTSIGDSKGRCPAVGRSPRMRSYEAGGSWLMSRRKTPEARKVTTRRASMVRSRPV